MKTLVHPSASRGTAKHSWFQTNFSFSSGNSIEPYLVQFRYFLTATKDPNPMVMEIGNHVSCFNYFSVNTFSEETQTTYSFLGPTIETIILAENGIVIADNETLSNRRVIDT